MSGTVAGERVLREQVLREHVLRVADAFLDVLEPGVELDEDGALQSPQREEFGALAGFAVPQEVEFGVREALTRLGVVVGDGELGPRAGEFSRPGSFRDDAVGDLVKSVAEEFRAAGTSPGADLPAEFRSAFSPGTPAAPREDTSDLESSLPVRFLWAFDALAGTGTVRLTRTGDLRLGDAREIAREVGRPLGQEKDLRRVQWFLDLWDLLRNREEVLLTVRGGVVTAELNPRWREPVPPEWIRGLLIDHEQVVRDRAEGVPRSRPFLL